MAEAHFKQNILAFDSSGKEISVTVTRANSAELNHQKQVLRFGHAAALIPFLKESLEVGGLTFKELDIILTTRGPGGFTGLRAGLASAKALSQSLDIPAYGVSSFAATIGRVSPDVFPDHQRLALLDSHRRDFYSQLFHATGKVLSEPSVMSLEQVKELVSQEAILPIGNGALLLEEDEQWLPDDIGLFLQTQDMSMAAGLLTWLGQIKAESESFPTTALYVRPPDVSLPKS